VNGRLAALLELGAGFNPEFTGRENAVLNGALLGISADEIQKRMPQIEAFAEIGAFIDYPLKTYSSGMYVRLAFAVLTQVKPDILIVDEALAVGDFLFQQKCFDAMRGFRESGATFLFVSHSMGMVLELCSRALVLDKGRVIFDGPAAEAVPVYEENAVRARYGAKAKGQIRAEMTGDRHGGTPQARPPSYDLSSNLNQEILRKRPGAIASDDIELVFLRVLDAAFDERIIFQTGEYIIISIGFRSSCALEEPHIGFKIRDKMGRVLFETSSLCMRQHPGPVNPGEMIVGNFRFRNSLATGDYSVTMGFSEGSVGECSYREALVYIQDVCPFTVVASPSDILWSGLSHLYPAFSWSVLPPR